MKIVVTSRTATFDPDLKLEAGASRCQHLDVTDPESVNRLFRWLKETDAVPSVLINNAGVGFFKPLRDLSYSEWQQMVEVNLTGAFLCTVQATRGMVDNGGGRIINIGSIVDKKATPGNVGYGASKWGLRGFSRTVAEESKGEKICVTHISMGAVWSDIWEGRVGFSKEDMLDVEHAAEVMAYVATLPLSVRIDEMEMTPPKGIL